MEIILEAPHHPQKANEKGPSFGNTWVVTWLYPASKIFCTTHSQSSACC
jgi:hypothetical protein